MTPQTAVALGQTAGRTSDAPLLVVSPFVSRSTRERLREGGLNWLDLTGNVRLVLQRPGLFIETSGADRLKGGGARPARSMKGPAAGRLVESVLAALLPVGVTEIARRANVDPGYASRLLELLRAEALVERGARGEVTAVDKPRLVRRWAEDAPMASRGKTLTLFEPRGTAGLKERLKETTVKYAVTGSLAAQQWAPIAPPRLVQIYVNDGLTESAAALGLRPVGSGGNVQLIRSRDPRIVETATAAGDGLMYAKPLQVVLDLLTSPGRAPSEADELLRWMDERADAWA